MNRKTFIKRIGLAGGALTVIPPLSLLNSCEATIKERITLTDIDIPFLNDLAETILPASDDGIPGAKAANVGAYLLSIYQDCMSTEDQNNLVDGINTIEKKSTADYNDTFQNISKENQLKVLLDLQEEAIAYNEKNASLESPEEEPITHYFDALRDLVISGYYTSEIGMTQARNYLPIPGKFESCIPYSKTDKPWALRG